MIKNILLISLLFCCLGAFAQQDSIISAKQAKSNGPVIDSADQRDAIDVLRKIFKKGSPNNDRKKPSRLNFAVVPAIGYSLSTGFAFDVSSNVAFYTAKDHTKQNLSVIDAEGVVDTKSQKLLISRSEIWSENNDYKLTTDLRLERFPDDTYGLGTAATDANDDPIVFSYVRTYVTLFKKIIPDFYIGLGYNLDYHFNIAETSKPPLVNTGFQQYGITDHSTSSGLNANLLFDNRRNRINPKNGGYASLMYRDNFEFLGSGYSWREAALDVRRYFRVSAANNNILAFWAIATFTSGNVPYLDLPATGDDTYNNSGRGYAENRFRGRDRLYIESEYRFGITSNGLLGGVAFANAESYTGALNNTFQKVAPSVGTGIRIKINKHSNTNVAIDYAVGIYGSKGLFVNLGEVF